MAGDSVLATPDHNVPATLRACSGVDGIEDPIENSGENFDDNCDSFGITELKLMTVDKVLSM